MKTFDDVKIGDEMYYGRIMHDEYGRAAFPVEVFVVENIYLSINGNKLFHLKCKESDRFPKGLGYQLFVSENNLSNCFNGTFFTENGPDMAEKYKLGQMALRFKGSNNFYRRCHLFGQG